MSDRVHWVNPVVPLWAIRVKLTSRRLEDHELAEFAAEVEEEIRDGMTPERVHAIGIPDGEEVDLLYLVQDCFYPQSMVFVDENLDQLKRRVRGHLTRQLKDARERLAAL